MRRRLKNDFAEIEAEDVGAELVSLKFGGTERLWQNPTGVWEGHAPVLFPVCGNCSLGGAPMPRHGFARKSLFRFEPRDDSLCFRLEPNGTTRAVYPYDFLFSVRYALRGNALDIFYEAENRGDAPMPYSWGGHVSHALFSPLEEHSLLFPEEEAFLALAHDGDGKLTGKTCDLGAGKRLFLSESSLSGGNTLIFRVRSRSVSLCDARGTIARIDFEGFPYLLLWRPDGARMICVEPWGNLPDRADESLPLAQKEGIGLLPAGGIARAKQTISYYEVSHDLLR